MEDKSNLNYYVKTYDEAVDDWPGEMDFYYGLAGEVKTKGGSILEVACGTGRVAVRLARTGVRVVGLDLSREMLALVEEKSRGMSNASWFEADMRSFDLKQKFDLVIIPGHAFQNLNTAQDQADCLDCINSHLKPGGRLVIHLDCPDFAWLGSLLGEKGSVFADEHEFKHPQSGNRVRESKAWTFEPSTQTAIERTRWVELDENGDVISERITEPVQLHAIFPLEVEHLLQRTGYDIEATFGDFDRSPFTDKGPQMIWLAKTRNS
jgi:SAM-dependent methyltransferase